MKLKLRAFLQINLLKKWKERGNKLILWTCREGVLLAQAVDWCRTQGLTFDAVNDNLEEMQKISVFLKTIKHKDVEFLPYHKISGLAT